MADIKNYMKEKAKREQKQADYKEKIVRHKLASVYRILLIIVIFAALIVLMVVQYKRHTYTDYEVLSSAAVEITDSAREVKLGDSILTYSKDGAHCMDSRGNVNWNQTFEIQDIVMDYSGDTVAMGEYNGRSLYLADSEKLIGEVTTTMPIRDLAVSEAGYVTAVLADTEVTWINTYDSSGKLAWEGRSHMNDSGYPMAVTMSPSGELLLVAYVYVDAGILKTTVAFYNFGDVGSNVSDHLVSTYSYTDMLIPFVKYIDDDTAFAVGDSRLMIYSGNRVPVTEAEHLYDREILGVYYNERYIGLVFASDNNENRYQLKVYDTENTGEKIFYFDLEYTDIFLGGETLVIYNETECQILTMDGMEKYHGNFEKTVRMMLPLGNTYKYLLLTDDSIETIQLK